MNRSQTQPLSGRSQQLIRLLLIVVLWLALMAASAAPAIALTEQELTTINQQWETSAHALNDVNCQSCHQNEDVNEGAFVANPTYESCQSCHEAPVETFLLGKHGIRLLEGESALSPKVARIPMKHDAFTQQMNCNACHNVHTVNTLQASVDSCLTCHNDNHSLNYKNSKHGKAVFAGNRLKSRTPSPQRRNGDLRHLPPPAHRTEKRRQSFSSGKSQQHLYPKATRPHGRRRLYELPRFGIRLQQHFRRRTRRSQL